MREQIHVLKFKTVLQGSEPSPITNGVKQGCVLVRYFLPTDAFQDCDHDIVTHCTLNRLPHTVYWQNPVSILGTSSYEIEIFIEKNGSTICKQGFAFYSVWCRSALLPITLLWVFRLQWANLRPRSWQAIQPKKVASKNQGAASFSMLMRWLKCLNREEMQGVWIAFHMFVITI